MAKRILVIDDEKEILQLIKKKLQSVGYEVFTATDGNEGLNVAKEVHPHLILTDIAMPEMDGFVFCNELKNCLDIQHIPIIVCSAHGGSMERMKELGSEDFLTKPFSPQALVDKVAQFLNQKRALKILVATKMLMLMKSIIQEAKDSLGHLEIVVINDQQAIVEEALKFGPDLMIIDVDMFSVIKADEIVKTIRLQDKLKNVTILVNRNTLGDQFTSNDKEINVTIKECLQSGASHFVGHLNKESFLLVVDEYCYKKS